MPDVTVKGEGYYKTWGDHVACTSTIKTLNFKNKQGKAARMHGYVLAILPGSDDVYVVFDSDYVEAASGYIRLSTTGVTIIVDNKMIFNKISLVCAATETANVAIAAMSPTEA